MKNIGRLTHLERREIAKKYDSSHPSEAIDKAINLCDKFCGYDPEDESISVDEMLRYIETRSSFLLGVIAMYGAMED